MTGPFKKVLVAVSLVCMSFSLVSAEVIDRIVAVVNEDIITLSQLNKSIEPFLKQIEAQGFPEDKEKQIVYNLKTDMLERMIDRKLADQEAKRHGITVSDSEVDNAIEQFKKAQSVTHDELVAAVEEDGIDYETYRQRVKKELLRPKLINYAVKSKIIITDQDVQDYYKENIEDFAGKQKYRLRHILNDRKELMDEVKIRLENNESFSSLAELYSKSPNASQGGLLGLFEMDDLAPEIQESLEGLEKGDYTKVVETDQGYQLFYVDDIVITDRQPLEAVYDQIMETLYNKEAEQKFNDWLESMKKEAYIKKML